MNIVFEHVFVKRNFINYDECPEDRFKVSPMMSALLRYNSFESQVYRDFLMDVEVYGTPNDVPEDEKYVIPSGVAYHPNDWCGPDEFVPETNDKRTPDKKPLFEYLSKEYLKDLQSGRAFLMLDQSHEGYQTDWLWPWFHNMCDKYSIMPKQIIYVTGNLNSELQYQNWADTHNLVNRLKVIGYAHFEMTIKESTDNYVRIPPYYNKPIDFEEQIEYKLDNLSAVKSYNALQKRTRAHRIWLFYGLVKNNLIDQGINSMNDFDIKRSFYEGRILTPDEYDLMKPYLPILPFENPEGYTIANFADGDCGNYITSINRETSLNSWFSVISEASFAESEHTCFLSEKTFKPIICSQPFIIFGNKGSLKHLRKMGYKTFSPWINEKYDELDTWYRYEAILDEIKRLCAMTVDEKIKWFEGMQEILEHNFNQIYHNSTVVIPTAVVKFKQYIEEQDNV